MTNQEILQKLDKIKLLVNQISDELHHREMMVKELDKDICEKPIINTNLDARFCNYCNSVMGENETGISCFNCLPF